MDKSETITSTPRLIEDSLPLRLLSEKSKREMTGNARPPIREMHFWWARRPLIVSRAAVVGALLPAGMKNFAEKIRLDQKDPYHHNPLIEPNSKIKVLDPFAGGGSIPFEAARAGCDTCALEYNPVAYIILKATLEYPARYGQKLVDNVKKWSQWLLQRVKEEVGPYWPEGVLTYIWNWLIRCPHCGQDTLFRKDWSLSEKKQIYLVPEEDGIRIVKGSHPTLRNLVKGKGICTRCNRTIAEEYIKGEFKKYFAEQPNAVKLKLIVAVERNKRGKSYRIVTAEEGALGDRCQDLMAKKWEELVHNDLIPTETLPPYVTVRATAYGVRYWYQLFSPRQLLTLTSLVKNIKEARKILAETEGEDYAKAVTTCLALILDKFADYNSRVTRWHSRNEQISNTMGFRSPTVGSDFPEVNPFEKTSGSLVNMISDVVDGLQMAALTLTHRDMNIRVDYGSVLRLPYRNSCIDLIITDPPYEDDIPYAELSDYFYVWLKRAIGDTYPEAFAFRTLWEEATSEEVSKDPSRYYQAENKKQVAEKHYEELLNASFIEIDRVLKDDGLLVVFFSHSTTAAWARLIKALTKAGFTIKRAWPVHTEQVQRVTAFRGEVIDTSLIVSARKRKSDSVGYLEDLRPTITQKVRAFVKELVAEQGTLSWADLLNTSMGPALEILTQYKEVRSIRGGLEVIDVLDEVSRAVTQAMLENILGSVARPDVHSCLYLLLRTTRFNSAISDKLPFDYVRRVCLSLAPDFEVDHAKKQRIITEVTEKGKKFIQVLYPRSQEELDSLLAKRGLSLKDSSSKELLAVDVVHLAEVAYAKGGKTKLLELLSNLEEIIVSNAYTTLEALYKALPEKDGERELIRPLLNIWPEVIQECRKHRSERAQKRLDQY